MPWFFPFPFTESMKKRACRYLLQHYMGHLLKQTITLEQMSVDLYNGKGTVTDVNLDVVSLNEALDEYGVPVEIVDGFIGRISVSVPWSALLSDNSMVEIHNLELTIQPKERAENSGLAFESMLFSSMTTSMQLAEECLKQDRSEEELKADTARPFEGLVNFAQTIEAVLSKIKVCFNDTIIRLEHVTKDSSTGAALEIKISRIEYYDDLASSPSSSAAAQQTVVSSPQKQHPVYEVAAIAVKNVHLMGVRIYCDQLKAECRTVCRTPVAERTDHQMALNRIDSFSESPDFSSFATGHQNVVTGQPTGNGRSSTTTKRDRKEETPTKDSEPVLIMTISSKQEIKLKIKQKEEIPGAKLELDCHIGCVNVHLSPHLVHLLTDIASGLISPGMCDNSNTQRVCSKKMVAEDYRKVEQELQKQMPKRGGGEGNHLALAAIYHQQLSGASEDGLSTQPIDDDYDDDDDIYMSIARNHSGTSSMDSSMSSSATGHVSSSSGFSCVSYSKKPPAPSSTSIKKSLSCKNKDPASHLPLPQQQPHPPPLHHYHSTDDPSSELNRLKVKVTFLSVVVLHEDPPSDPSTSSRSTSSSSASSSSSSMDKLRDAAVKFFSRVQSISLSGATTVQGLEELRHEYSQACPFDHLGLLCKPITVEVSKQCSPLLRTLTADVSLGLLEIIESVFDHRATTSSAMGFHLPIENVLPDYCKLLTFYKDEASVRPPQNIMFSSMQLAVPCVKVKVKSIENPLRNSRRRGTRAPNTMDVQVDMTSCKTEIDVTIVDRIHALLNPRSSSSTNNIYASTLHQTFAQTDQSLFVQTIDDEDIHSSNRKIDLQFSCILLTLDIRFPKVDLSSHRVDKPWWQRSLQSEHLILIFDAAKVKTSFDKSAIITELEVTCKNGEGSFQLNKERPVLFIRIGTEESTAREREEGFDWPRMMIRKFPIKQSILDDVLDEKEMSTMTTANGGIVNGDYQFAFRSEPSPFSSKKVMYESEELLMPGDRRDMTDFQDKIVNNCLLTIELSLPNVVAFLPNKEFFEVLYNRVLNDFVLWQPAAPIPVDIQESNNFMAAWSPEFVSRLVQPGRTQGLENFSFCKSGGQYDSSSDSEDGSTGDFVSMADQKSRQQQQQRRKMQQQHLQSKMCISINIGHGRLNGYVPHQDSNDVHGEFLLETVDLAMMAVTCYEGDPELQYLCLQINRATLFHNGHVRDQCEAPDLDVVTRLGFAHLEPTIYLSEEGIPTKLRGKVGRGNETQDMLSLTIKITSDSYTSKKDYLVAAGLRSATLRHRTVQSGLSWFDQLLNFLNVTDFPIPGYSLPTIITELHGYLWSCSIDYRPLYLPCRALVTLESFSLSSNIIAESAVSVMRFLLDDAALFISDKIDISKLDVKTNYVCVVDVGVFELSLRTSNGKDPKHPKFNLEASNNLLNIRTCSDSCTALAELINYLARCGDITSDDDIMSSSDKNEPVMMRADSSGNIQQQQQQQQGSPLLGQPYMEQVPDLMDEAMQESPSVEDASDDLSDSQSPIGYMPSCTSASSSIDSSQMSSDATDDGHTVLHPAPCDEDFCIIDEYEPGLGIRPRDGEPVVRVLTEELVKVIENHFRQPLTKTDLLKAPDHFPPAVNRYTLNEISLVWYMYGGRDFDSSPPGKVSTHSPKSNPRSRVDRGPQGPTGWQARGGPGRDINTLMELCLNKMRLQHEVYPDIAPQASRQVLLVSELEIRDRLALSKINKFLYLYSSGTVPRQSHANMVMIKALHIRPDQSSTQKECLLKVSIQPLRLNIDQDALFFFRTFFAEISSGSSGGSQTNAADLKCSSSGTAGTGSSRPRSSEPPSSLSSTPKHTPPVMGVGQAPTYVQHDSPELLMTFEEAAEAEEKIETEREAETDEMEDGEDAANRTVPIYFKSFVFSPDVPVRLDYEGKWVDMEQGTLTGIVVGLAKLNCSELKLKRLNYQHGLLGVDRLLAYATNEWLQDIRKHQLPSLLGGVGPMYSLVQLVQGCRDLFWLPVEQYRKDGRIVRGLQRGANSFVTCTAMSMLELTNRMVQTVQYAAEAAYDVVSPGLSAQTQRQMKRLTHPADLREGVANAYTIIKDGFCGTAKNIYTVAVHEHENKGVTGALGGVIRQIPSTVIEPVIIATEATSNVLGGMRNQLLPDRRKEDEEKWKSNE